MPSVRKLKQQEGIDMQWDQIVIEIRGAVRELSRALLEAFVGLPAQRAERAAQQQNAETEDLIDFNGAPGGYQELPPQK